MGTKCGQLGASIAEYPKPQEKGQKMPEGVTQLQRRMRGRKEIWNAMGKRLGEEKTGGRGM